MQSETVEERLAGVRARMAGAAARAGRAADGVTLVAVSKGAERAAIAAAAGAGVRVFGENRIATAEEHFVPPPYSLPDPPALHLIGHLQTNKARRAASLFGMIHSVDSLRLAEVLERHRAEGGDAGRLPILFEVNIGGEESKSGFAPDAVADAVAAYIALAPAHLQLQGLMTIAPATATPEETRPYFRRMAALFAAISVQLPAGGGAWDWRHLSMGMTNDFEVAIEEGATLVRIGRAIFG